MKLLKPPCRLPPLPDSNPRQPEDTTHWDCWQPRVCMTLPAALSLSAARLASQRPLPQPSAFTCCCCCCCPPAAAATAVASAAMLAAGSRRPPRPAPPGDGGGRGAPQPPCLCLSVSVCLPRCLGVCPGSVGIGVPGVGSYRSDKGWPR